LRSYFASFGAAHPIEHGIQPELRFEEDHVLVLLSACPTMRLADTLYLGLLGPRHLASLRANGGVEPRP
jgi:hypothetical protein